MRRRIYINPEGSLEDHTTDAHLWDMDQEPGGEADWCRTGTLRDDALWERYLTAVKAEADLRREVVAKLAIEDWDETERQLAGRADVLLHGDYSPEAMDAIQAEALENAKRAH